MVGKLTCFGKAPPIALLHLAALGNGNVLNRLSFGVGCCSRILNLGYDVHAFNDIAKHNVLTVQMRCSTLGRDDEELTSIRVLICARQHVICVSRGRWAVSYWARVCHGQQTRLVVLEGKVLIGKLVHTPNGS